MSSITCPRLARSAAPVLSPSIGTFADSPTREILYQLGISIPLCFILLHWNTMIIEIQVKDVRTRV